jgi:hypothetical protein
MMTKAGFSQKCIGSNMLCIASVEYSIVVNAHMVGPIIPGRGLRQDDPLTPSVFITCGEGLLTLIQQAENRGELHGIKICMNT